jgi:hypothetical protein
MDTKTQFYHSIGDGRDSYIHVNNGGLFPACQPLPELAVSTFGEKRRAVARAAKPPDRTMRYHSNGSGRDNYIVSTSGGFESQQKRYSPRATFYRSLREPETFMRSSLGGADGMELQRSWLPLHQRLLLSKRNRMQRELTMRLSQRRTSLPPT